jgi:hypothetical protein
MRRPDSRPCDERVEDGSTPAVPSRRPLSDAERTRLRRRLAQRILSGDIPVDLAAAEEVHRTGWARP